MNYWQYTPYVLPLIGAGILSLSLALSAWWRPPNTGRYAFIALMLSISWWALGYSVELGVSTLSAKIFWTNLQYLGISLVPVSWLVFALQYAGREEWLNRRTISYLLIWPLITQLLAWTNPSHHLFRARAWVQSAGPFPVLEVDFAIGFWLHALYSYLLILLGVYLLVRAQLHARRLYRRQVIALLAASILPWVGNALFIFDLWEEMPAYDLTPFFFSITGLAISWGMLRFQLLEIVPIARETVLENLRDGVLVLDVQNRIADANPAALEMLGRPEQAVVGQSAQHVFSQWPEVKARYRNVVEIQEEITLYSATTPRVYDLRITPLLDSAQKTTGRVVVMRDITVRKAAEEEREILISELNAFAHTVAHELKNPLTMIKAGADLLAGERALQQDAATQNLVRTISHGGAKMGSIIDELLLLASLRQRKDLPLTPLDMAPIVEEALQRLSYLSQKQQAEIIMLGGDWPQVLGYAPLIEEVWVNYLSNALKYGGSPPRIELGYDRQLSPEREARFWVRDNGPGLSVEKQAELFTPFTRLAETGTTGNGLGLSIVERIVTRLSGTVGVESVEGQGSTFFFTLPTGAS